MRGEGEGREGEGGEEGVRGDREGGERNANNMAGERGRSKSSGLKTKKSHPQIKINSC